VTVEGRPPSPAVDRGARNLVLRRHRFLAVLCSVAVQERLEKARAIRESADFPAPPPRHGR
jgi:hypothetical protein